MPIHHLNCKLQIAPPTLLGGVVQLPGFKPSLKESNISMKVIQSLCVESSCIAPRIPHIVHIVAESIKSSNKCKTEVND